MKKLSLLAMLVAAFAFAGSAQAQLLISNWNFENTTLSTTPGLTSGSIAADSGPGQAIGVHAASSLFATPTGNGSEKAFNALHWTVGDYYQFQTSTTGYNNILITFNQISGTFGPADFKLAYSTDGINFTDFTNYTVLENVSPNTWNSGIAVISTSFSEDLSAIDEVTDAATVYFRLIDTSTGAAGGGTVTNTGGSRIDNFSVSGDLLAVPEPSSGVLGFIALSVGVLCARRYGRGPELPGE